MSDSISHIQEHPTTAPSLDGVAPAPRVSVCLPVYQGEAYVQAAIDSVLQQSFTNLELIVSDNASIDRTGDIVRAAAANDPRVRYVRSDVNRGLAWNHNRAFELARGEYAMWIGHDDVIAPDYVERCVAALEQDPGAVLAYTHSSDIDDSGVRLRDVDLPIIAQSNKASRRYRDAVQYESRCDVIFGVMRSAVLRQTRLHGGFHGSDWVLIAEMALRGRFAFVPAHLFSRRKHVLQSSRLHDRWQSTVVFDPRKAGRTTYPFLRLAREFDAITRTAGLSFVERLRCRRHLAGWMAKAWRYVRDDLRVGLSSAVKNRLSHRQVERVKSAKRWLVRS